LKRAPHLDLRQKASLPHHRGARRALWVLMGWMPPPDGIEVCHAGDVA
jgi:hypothetical protein